MGLLLPLPVYALFYGLDLLMKMTGIWHGLSRPENIYLLSMAGNVLLFRIAYIRWKRPKTGKGVLLVTIALVLAFFYLFFQQPY